MRKHNMVGREELCGCNGRVTEVLLFCLLPPLNLRSNAACTQKQEQDINKVLDYFSYEHFYVLYCKFWELDGDHDFLLDRDDLVKLCNYTLTYRIVDR